MITDNQRPKLLTKEYLLGEIRSTDSLTVTLADGIGRHRSLS